MPVRCSLAVLIPLLLAAEAVACDCDQSATAKKGLEGSTAVFSGKVLKIAKVNEYEVAVTFGVDRQWKGVAGKEVVVRTSNSGASCGYEFKPGTSYLIYAVTEAKAKHLSTNICTRTRAIADAKEDLKELGEGKKVP